MSNGWAKNCNGCGGGSGDCYEDVIWHSGSQAIGNTVCGFINSWTINGNQYRITIDSAGNAVSRNRDSYQTSCMICMCDGILTEKTCPSGADSSEGDTHYYRQMDANGMTYTQAQAKCTGDLEMARFQTQEEYNLISALVGKLIEEQSGNSDILCYIVLAINRLVW